MPTNSLNKPIRIMHVVDILGLAGMEYGVIKVVNRLDPERFFPMICCLRFQTDGVRPLLDRRIPVFELRKRVGRDFRIIFALAALLRRHAVDIVHSHNWGTFLYATFAARLARVPILIHGEHGRDSQVVRQRQLLLSRWLVRQAAHLVVVSSGLGRELVETWKVPLERVLTIPNGVDLETFGRHYPLDALRREFQLNPENRVVLNIGQLRPIKDHPTLVRAFARLHAEFPDVRLLLVGHAGGVQPELEKLVELLGIREAVRFAGTRHDIPQLLALCDVYVNSSLFEGMSNTILEAMAARKPVVATAVGGNPELVRDGVTGYLVPPGDDPQLAERLEQLLTNPALARRLGDAGRAHAERHHPMTSMVQAYHELYQEKFLRDRLKQAASSREKIKANIARGLCWSGLNLLKETTGPAQLTILTYHRVLPLHEALAYSFPSMVMPRDIFEAQMAYLARNNTVLAFPEAIRLLQRGQLPRRAVAVTFDDGYRDNYEHAWPILKKHGIPATFFVVTGALDRSLRLWWDVVAEDIQQLSRRSLPQSNGEHSLPAWLVSLLKRSHDSSPQTLAQEVVQRLNSLPCRERQQSLEGLHALAGLAPDQPPDLMMTWDQVQDLQRCGMQIGAHTVTHAFLDELEEERVRQEIEGGIERIQERLGVRPHLLAYPRGRFAESLRELLQQAGIEAAVTTKPGRNRPGSDLLKLKRLDAGYSRLGRGFDPFVFSVEIGGWFSPFRQG